MPGFAVGIGAGLVECQCGQTGNCGDIIRTELAVGLCQDVSFSLFSVKTLNGGSRPDYSTGSQAPSERLFESFHIDSLSGNLNFTTFPHWTGSYRVEVLALDNGNSLLGTAAEVGSENETAAGSGNTDLDLIYSVEFHIVSKKCSNPRRNISCDALFSQQPFFNEIGDIFFVLHPLANGQVEMIIRAVNGGEEPVGGFMEYQASVVISDANEPPTCTFASEVAIFGDLGPILIPNFLINGSVGNNEGWQNLIVQITPKSTDRGIFAGSDGPTVDSSGSLLFETKAGSYGSVIMSVVCLDDGGTRGGGSNTSQPTLITLHVLPRPTVSVVSPAILPVTSDSSAVLTITGQHFGGRQSRGYVSENASVHSNHVQALLDGIPCRNTRYISDTELLCTGVEDGQGVHDVEVRIADPFFVNKMATSKVEANKSNSTTIAYPV
eukprot:CAMPEP_0173122162 /NCGR_PEP_ID=MMETSP1102-20130122/53927_1 /TAXON_ID=49646 /ORGANISM="Geminigera sp., Strain Caron Lab Isolate" /LENGTH=436 /DNA_ID=CAMNT_0014029327 /DNA_START=18 /DNA_END=1326 /DNA_ORIENTATION=-